MIDPVSAAVVLATLAVGYLLGRLQRRRFDGRPRPVCGCYHARSMHDEAGCHATVQRESVWDAFGAPAEWEHVRCPCKAYDGPVPALELTFPEVTTRGEED